MRMTFIAFIITVSKEACTFHSIIMTICKIQKLGFMPIILN